MKYMKVYTPKFWEFGFGHYHSEWFTSKRTGLKTLYPSVFVIMFGPWSFEFSFGNEIEVILPASKQELE